jgi:hypothetical protein
VTAIHSLARPVDDALGDISGSAHVVGVRQSAIVQVLEPDSNQGLFRDLGDEGLRLLGVPPTAVDDDRVDLDPQILRYLAARLANRSQRDVADDDDVDIAWRRTRLAPVARRPRSEYECFIDAANTAERLGEPSEYSDGLKEDRAQFGRPREIPIGTDEPVSPDHPSDDKTVVLQPCHLSAHRGLRNVSSLGKFSNG